ncbi:Atg2p Ecym_6491 [Eremothecium cymbalariae DBVPG|uniref:Autophagy-related protein 2 n=1 Tax=Eremothecium cymbalariae (strain CBS 270.75 / DBVPG 7215 / KCTC 17166 / NRRL Y-17582) TaxID=931890 RepID=G8JUS9_ERECY|nr:hypothetical protein Ecym_6491 [Eremothecium cymbalariae DBVPG\
MSSWLPQNVQKRLLIYVLQQISIFSHIDTSNLDVSLGCRSHFAFHDLQLDVDNISVPNISIRTGHIAELDLKLAVSGGLDINGEGVTFVIGLEVLNESCSKDIAMSLAKSVMDLTNSMIHPLTDNIDDDDILTHSSCESGDFSKVFYSPSALSAMRNKVLEMTLANLTIKLTHINIQMILPDDDCLQIMIESAEFLTIGSCRRVNVKGVSVSHSEISTLDESDDVVSNSVLASIYMSAMDSIPKLTKSSRPEISMNGRKVAKLDTINITFQGISSIDDMHIHDTAVSIGTVQIFFDTIFGMDKSVLNTILQFLTELKQPVSNTEPSDKLRNYKRFKVEQNIEEELKITEVHLSHLSLIFPSDMKIILDDMDFKNGAGGNCTAFINAFGILEQNKQLFHLDNQSNKPLVYFTADGKNNYNTLSLDEDVTISLTPNFVNLILLTVSRLESLIKSYTKFDSHSQEYPQQELNMYVKSKNVFLDLQLNDCILRANIQPISYQLPLHSLSIESIVFTKIIGSKSKSIAQISDIKFGSNVNHFKVNSYNLKLSETLITSKQQGSIGGIRVNCSENDLKDVISGIVEYSDIVKPYINNKVEVPQTLLNKSVRIMNPSSIIHKQNVFSNMVFLVSEISVSVLFTSLPSFGKISVALNSCLLSLNTDNTIIFHASTIEGYRCTSGAKQRFLEPIKANDRTKPALFLQKFENWKIKLNIWNVCIHYYAKWLDVLADNKFNNASTSSDRHEKVTNLTQQRIEVKLHDCAIMMKPYRLDTALVVCVSRCMTDLQIPAADSKVILRTATFMLIDDLSNMKLGSTEVWSSISAYYTKCGFTTVGRATTISTLVSKEERKVSISVDIDRVDLSLCADSFQCLLQTLTDLKPPVSFPDEKKYRTEISHVPVFQDVDDNFFVSKRLPMLRLDFNDMHIFDDFIDNTNDSFSVVHITEESEESSPTDVKSVLRLEESHFGKSGLPVSSESDIETSALVSIVVKASIKKASIKLHDGYDWIYTRKSISKVVEDMEDEVQKQIEPARVEASLFDSIYLYASSESNIKKIVNNNIHADPDNGFETSVSKMKLRPSKNHKILIELINTNVKFTGYEVDEPTEEEADWSADILNRTEVDVETFEIIDNVPTSTWNKFVTILKKGRKNNSPMFSLLFTLVRPIDFLYATEVIITANILPLRLHVDQDTLDFLTRFGEFKDRRFELIDKYPDIIYIQRFEVNSVDIILDYKPKKLDYVGLKSGHTAEFMNFFTLDGAKITLKRVVLYGVDGLQALNGCLSNIWTPDITRFQLSGVLKGVAPLKSIITLGSGVKALVTVPIKEYQQDQRLTRSLQKGARDFIKTTSGELIRLGVRMASGTQTILENTEEFFGGQGSRARGMNGRPQEDDQQRSYVAAQHEETNLFSKSNPRNKSPVNLLVYDEDEHESLKVISLYADQPLNAQNGVQEAYGSLGKNFNIAYGAMKRAHREVKQSFTAQDAATAFARATPIAFIRPMIGATEAISKTLQGISNQMDHEQLVYMQDKYKQSSKRSGEQA